MSKYVNVTVSTSLSTDFFIEVPDNADEAKIRELAEKEVVLPNKYPEVLEQYLKNRMGIQIQGLDSMLKDWSVDEVEYIFDNGGDKETSAGE